MIDKDAIESRYVCAKFASNPDVLARSVEDIPRLLTYIRVLELENQKLQEDLAIANTTAGKYKYQVNKANGFTI